MCSLINLSLSILYSVLSGLLKYVLVCNERIKVTMKTKILLFKIDNRLINKYLKIKKTNLIAEVQSDYFTIFNQLKDELVKQMLVKNCKINSFEISRGKYGKPYIAKLRDIHFNLSHCENYLVLVIDQNEVGVDIEKINRVTINFALKMFHKNELHIINDFPNLRQIILTLIWSMKEAYLKYKGIGLKTKLNSFNVFSNDIYPHFVNLIFREYIIVIYFESVFTTHFEIQYLDYDDLICLIK